LMRAFDADYCECEYCGSFTGFSEVI
jgi:hypothetical protein